MLPTSTTIDLANEYFRKHNNVSRRSITQDPDGFFANDSLQPDPVFMGLRAIVHTGPIGAFVRWVDRKIEARDDRIYGSRIQDTLPPPQLTDHPCAVVDRDDDERLRRQIAA